MKVSQNIGIVNALIRITIGLTVVSWSTAKFIKHPWRDSYLIIILLGAMKVAEGIVRFCPWTFFYDKCRLNVQQPNGVNDSFDSMEGLNQEQMPEHNA